MSLSVAFVVSRIASWLVAGSRQCWSNGSASGDYVEMFEMNPLFAHRFEDVLVVTSSWVTRYVLNCCVDKTFKDSNVVKCRGDLGVVESELLVVPHAW